MRLQAEAKGREADKAIAHIEAAAASSNSARKEQMKQVPDETCMRTCVFDYNHMALYDYASGMASLI